MFEKPNVVCSSRGGHDVPDNRDATYNEVLSFIRSGGDAPIGGGDCKKNSVAEE